MISSLGPGLPSSTGAPEGDPVSVLGMLAVCWVFVRLLDGLVQPSAYMDNWSWSTDLPDCHGPALLVLQDLTDSLRVQIDWGKTYTWGTSPASQNWWRNIGPAFVPKDVHLPIVSSAKELGSFFQFGHRPERKLFQAKVQEALQRLHKLAVDPQVLPLKARVAQAGVYPLVLRHGVPCPCLHHHQLFTWCSCTSCGWWPPHALRSCCTFRGPSCPGS